MPILRGPDCTLNVEVLGEGEPVTVFAHGITGSSDELAPLAARTPGTRVLMDFRGHGASGRPPAEAGYDHPAMRRDLECVADAWGADRAVGLSMGAGAILNLLADRPGRFCRIVLVTPASLDGPNEGATTLFPWMADKLEEMTLEEWAEYVINGPDRNPLFDQRPYWEELTRQRIMRMNRDGIPRALRAYTTGAPPVRDAEALCRIEAEALVIAHLGDPIHDDAVGRRVASLLPRATLRVWDEPLAMWDDVDAFARLIGEFIAG